MAETENELTPLGLKGGDAVLNVGHSRMRAIYQRKVGGEWVNTGWLPADPMSQNLYFSKGFRAPPKEEAIVESVKTSGCPWCDYETENPRALRTHLNKHINKEE